MNQSDWLEIKEFVERALFFKEIDRLRTKLLELQTQNVNLTGRNVPMMFRGQPILMLEKTLKTFNGGRFVRTKRVPVHPDIHDEVLSCVSSIGFMEKKQARVTQFFAVAKTRLDDLQDIRDGFPEVVVTDMLPPYISCLPRKREPGYAFLHPSGQGHMTIYEDFERVAYHYLANDLVYDPQ